MFSHKSIMISGGIGSFGNAFAPMTMSKYNPRSTVIAAGFPCWQGDSCICSQVPITRFLTLRATTFKRYSKIYVRSVARKRCPILILLSSTHFPRDQPFRRCGSSNERRISGSTIHLTALKRADRIVAVSEQKISWAGHCQPQDGGADRCILQR